MVHGTVRRPEALADFQFLKIELPESLSTERVDETQLPADWVRRFELTRALGDRWLGQGRAVLLMVHSVLVPETYNALINPRHPEAAQLRLLDCVRFPLDARLFGPG